MGGAGRPTAVGQPVELMGVAFHPMTERETVAHVVARATAGEGGWLMTPNLHLLRLLVIRPDLRALSRLADLRVADGMPLIWASRLAGTPLPERVAGSNLIHSVSAAAAAAGASVFLLGGDPGVAERARDRLTERHPRLLVAGVHSPPLGFEHRPEALRAIDDALDAARPALVLAGLPFPRQEKLIVELRERYPHTWFLGLGISLSFASGDVRRAPVWVQRLGLEWAHRLAGDPRRLFRRYVLEGLPFVPRLLAWSLSARWRGISGRRRR